MSENIERLQAGDFEQAMRFLNGVFGEHRPHDFATLLPSIYRPTDTHMECNYAIREKGGIRAVVGLFPLVWKVGDRHLRMAGIGGVSTHREVRGAGYMKALMNHCVARMRQEGYALSWLGGQRQRYLYFGYEKAGLATTYYLTRTNLRHCLARVPAICFEPLQKKDAERLQQARRLHEALPLRGVRPAADFYYYLLSWHNRPYAALDAEGRMLGYLVATEKGDGVVEVAARDEQTVLDLLCAWVAEKGDARIELPPLPTDPGRELGRIAESVSPRATGNWQVFAWEEVLEALLRLRAASGPLPAGRVVLGIEGYGGLCLEVEGGEGRCFSTHAAPALTCTPSEALRLLGGPLTPSLVRALPKEAALLEAWCPLPFFWPGQDGV